MTLPRSAVAEGLADKIFEEIGRQMEAKGLILKQGTIADATIINSGNRPLSDKKRKQLAKEPSSQVDTDAKATCKSGTWYVGYKGHIPVDARSNLIRNVAFTPANTHDSQLTDQLLSKDERSLFADKAYSRDADKQAARADGLYYAVLDKARRGRALRPHRRNATSATAVCGGRSSTRSRPLKIAMADDWLKRKINYATKPSF